MNDLITAGDADLLARFVEARDGEAFAELVRRHGPIVLAVCRRILAHRQDAEDAFQATFFVLAVRAHAFKRPELLPGWLFEVARRTAMKARSARLRRERLISRLSRMTPMKSAATAQSQDFSAILDAEIARLAPKYRTPVVLCYLQGRTNVEAARQLALPEGTLATRLRRAREILRDRVTSRGIGLSVETLGARLLASKASDPVPAALIAMTASGAKTMRAGEPATSLHPGISSRAMLLGQGVAKSMAFARLAAAMALVLAISVPVGVVWQLPRVWNSDLSLTVVDRQSGQPVPWATVRVVSDGHEEMLACDQQGRCAVPRPASSVASFQIFTSGSGYIWSRVVWLRKDKPRLRIPAAMSIPLVRGAIHVHAMDKTGQLVNRANRSAFAGPVSAKVNVDIDLRDDNGEPIPIPDAMLRDGMLHAGVLDSNGQPIYEGATPVRAGDKNTGIQIDLDMKNRPQRKP
ncbi:MAG TPA: sigma-70 family RNA polymerase sigma factor [Tepidisphaeraceae bacterium]|nr:sigma-70 family RNA polymerase sigma factor [Tepidisphaeraceae bacterium]